MYVMFREEMEKASEDYGIHLTSHQKGQFGMYYRLLMEWNQKMNLTAITDPREVAVKHMVDSMSSLDEKSFPENCSVIDVGTGAGFPGIPLKIIRPDIKLTLLDSLNKRVSFLKAIVDTLKLENVECLHGRAEETARNEVYREHFDVAVSRAVARLSILSEYCLPFVKVGGTFIAMKGMKYKEEMNEAQRAVKVLGGGNMKACPVKLPGIDDKRAVIYITKCSVTPKAYPRKAGTPERSPIS